MKWMGGWHLLMTPPGLFKSPEQLPSIGQPDSWISLPQVQSSAAAHRDLNKPHWEIEDYDGKDVWYFRELDLQEFSELLEICFDHATAPAFVYQEDRLISTHENSFLPLRASLASENLPLDQPQSRGTVSLKIHFPSVTQWLSVKRPRPRWKSKLISNQALRWLRIPFVGRMPGWSKPPTAVGLLAPPRIHKKSEVFVEESVVKSEVTFLEEIGEFCAVVSFEGTIRVGSGCPLPDKPLQVSVSLADVTESVLLLNQRFEPMSSCFSFSVKLVCRNVDVWWPHTHGKPCLYQPELVVSILESPEPLLKLDLPKIGFRLLQKREDQEDFAVVLNGVKVFCRGGCWTPLDPVSLDCAEDELRKVLSLFRDAGLNMIRVGGTMLYERPEFYEICDELGILVWQDFAFANLDYPFENPDFLKTVEAEVKHFLKRTSHHACLAVLCGGSEVQQQAAMQGLAKEIWDVPFYSTTLKQLCTTFGGEAYFLPSSPSGGDLPFLSNTGVAHYYGVGAYLRPLSDARLSEVKFASECLAFSNVPEDETLEKLLKNGEAPHHHPLWKQSVPRDHGTGWDFEDVRDHYLRELFKVDPMKLRYSDPDRYLRLSRVVTGEVMFATFCEWRRKASPCAGGLVWFLRDLSLGAGWGVIDSLNFPKACYFYLKRAFKAQTAFVSDEGVNGIEVHVCNETSESLEAQLSLSLWQDGKKLLEESKKSVHLGAHSTSVLKGGAFFPEFRDLSYAYRFGPSAFDVITLKLETAAEEHWCFFFPLGLEFRPRTDLGLVAEIEETSAREWQVQLKADAFCQSVALEIRGFEISDNYFHLAPGQRKHVKVTRRSGEKNPLAAPSGHAFALNSLHPVKILKKGT